MAKDDKSMTEEEKMRRARFFLFCLFSEFILGKFSACFFISLASGRKFYQAQNGNLETYFPVFFTSLLLLLLFGHANKGNILPFNFPNFHPLSSNQTKNLF